MSRYAFVLLYALLVLSTGTINAKRSFGGGGGRHSYPKSGGLSGGGHGYPSSGGSHGYPSSGGLSGGSRPSYPPSGTNHGYPSSGGTSGSHGYPSSGGLSGGSSYPSNTHHTSNHGYPAGKGLSGNTNPSGGQTNVHYHYNYNPPQQIRYTPVQGGAPVSYPVYRGTPPTYVYQYKDSGSKYGTLLAGLALLNLGTLAGGVYAATHNSGSSSSYKAQPGEICKFGVRKDNGDYEETKIDCQLITSFIFAEQAKTQNSAGTNATVVTTVTNTTTINTTNGIPESPPANVEPKYVMLPNGTLVPINMTLANVTSEGSPTNNSMTSSVTVTTVTNTTKVTNALDVKGNPVEVTPGMKCYVIRNSPMSNMKKTIPCGLLQTYAQQSLKRNSASRNIPGFTVLAAVCAALIMY